ncbi:uncharacterized protein LOC117109421 [Anneissia japonica]|uniref:uncharacterized protein LOC117109421 n=1 Tax=Anneissia japonica TaxID=1529436 RepID=UPI001425998C|nr:uncharacterized protein LOC117109421 [Anneissia japonica]
MVRETRHLWVGNLPDNIREDKVKEQFKRYGRVENVKLLAKRDSDGSPTALVDFLDINSATKAHDAVIKLGDRDLRIEYNNPDRSPNSLIPDEPSATRHRDYDGTNHGRHSRYERRGEGSTENRFEHPGSTYDRNFDRERIYNNNRTGQLNIVEDDTDSTTSSSFRNRRTYNNFYSHSRTDGNYEGNYYSGNREQYGPGYGRSDRSENYDSNRKSKNSSKIRTNKSKSGSSHSGSVSRSQSFSPSRSRSRSRSNSSDSRSSTSDNRSRRSKSSDKGSLNTDHTSSSGVNKQFGLCVKNLPTRSTDTSIKDGLFHEFKKFGQVTAVTVQGSGDDRFGIVFFKRSEDMEKAMQTSKGKLFFGSEMRLNAWDGPDIGVDESDIRYYEKEMDEYHPRATRTLFIGNLDRTVAREELAEAFQKFGDILDIEIKKPHGAQPFAFLQFSDIDSVVKARKNMDGEFVGKNKVKLGFGKSMATNCVWLDNLPQNTSENFLYKLFNNRFGSVSRVTFEKPIPKALVHFHNMDCAQKAVVDVKSGRLHISGRKLKVDFASRECQELFYDQIQRNGPTFTDRSRETSPTGSYSRFLNRENSSEFRASGTSSTGTTFSQYESRQRSRSNSYFGSGTRSGSFGEEGTHFSSNYTGSGNGTGGSTPYFNKQGSFHDGYNSGSGSYDPDDSYEKELRDYGHHQRERHEQQYRDGTPKRSSKDRSFDRSRKRRSTSADSRDFHSSDNSLQDYRSRSNSPEYCESKRAPRSAVSVQRKSRSRSLSPIGSTVSKKKYQSDSIEVRSLVDSDSDISKRGKYRSTKKDKDFEDSFFTDKFRKKSGNQSSLDCKYKDLKPEKLRTGRLKDAIEETMRANKRKEYEESRSKRVSDMLKNDSLETSLLNEGGYDSDRSLKKADSESQLKRRKIDFEKSSESEMLKKDDARGSRIGNHSERSLDDITLKDNENSLRTNIVSLKIPKSAVNRPTVEDHNIPVKVKSALYDKRLVAEKYLNTKREAILSEKPNKKELVNKFMRSLRTDAVEPVEMGLEDFIILKDDNNFVKQRTFCLEEKLKHTDKYYKTSKERSESKSPREKHSKASKFHLEDKVMLPHLLEMGESNGSASDTEGPGSDEEHFIKRDLNSFDQSRPSTRKISLKSSNIPEHSKPAIDASLSYRKQMEQQLRQQQNKDDGNLENKLSNADHTNAASLKDDDTVNDMVWKLLRLSPVEHMRKKPRRVSENAFYQPNEESFLKRSYRPRQSSEDEDSELKIDSKPTEIPISVKVDNLKPDNGRPTDPRLEPREQRLPVRREIQMTPKGTTIPLSVTVPEIESPTALTPISPIADHNSETVLAEKADRSGIETAGHVMTQMKSSEADSDISNEINYDKGINENHMGNLQGRVTPVHDEPLILPGIPSPDVQRDQVRRPHQFGTDFHRNAGHPTHKENIGSTLSTSSLTKSLHSTHAKFGFSRIPDVQDKTIDNAFLQPTSFEAKLSTFTLRNPLRTSVSSLSSENKTEPLSTRMMVEKGMYRIRKRTTVPLTEVSTSVATTLTSNMTTSAVTVTSVPPLEITKTSAVETKGKEEGEARGRRISIFDQDSARLAHSAQRFKPGLHLGDKSPVFYPTPTHDPLRRNYPQNLPLNSNSKGILPQTSSNLSPSVFPPLRRDSLPNNLHDPRSMKETVNSHSIIQLKEKPVILSESRTEDNNLDIISGKPVAPYTPVKLHTVEDRPQLKDHRDFVRISAAIPNQKSETAEPTQSATSIDSALIKKEAEVPQIKQEPAPVDDLSKNAPIEIMASVKEEIKREVTSSGTTCPTLPKKEENDLLPSPKEIKPDTTMAKLPNESAQSPPVVTTGVVLNPDPVPLKSILKKEKTDYTLPSGPTSTKSPLGKIDFPTDVSAKKPLKRKRSPSPTGKAINSNLKTSVSSSKSQSKVAGKPVAKKSSKSTSVESLTKSEKPAVGSNKKVGVKASKDKTTSVSKEQSKPSNFGKDSSKTNAVSKDSIKQSGSGKESKSLLKDSNKTSNVKDSSKSMPVGKETPKSTILNKDCTKLPPSKDCVKQVSNIMKDPGKPSTVSKDSNKSASTSKAQKEKKTANETETKISKSKDGSKENVTKLEKKENGSTTNQDKKKDEVKKSDVKEKDVKTKTVPFKGKKKEVKEKVKKEKVEDIEETKPVKKKVEEEVKLTKALKHLSGKSKRPDKKIKDEVKKEEGKVKHLESKTKEDSKTKEECKVKEDRPIKEELKNKKVKNSVNKGVKLKEKKPPTEIKKKILQVSDIYSDSEDSESDSGIRDIMIPKLKREGRKVIYDSSESEEEVAPVEEAPTKKNKAIKSQAKKSVKDKEPQLDVKLKNVKSKESQEKDIGKKDPQKKKKVDSEIISEKPTKTMLKNKEDAKESKKKDEKRKTKQDKEFVASQQLEDLAAMKENIEKEESVKGNTDELVSDIDGGDVSDNETNLKSSRKFDKDKFKKKVRKPKKEKQISEQPPVDSKNSKKSKKIKKKSTPTEGRNIEEHTEPPSIVEELLSEKRALYSDGEAHEFEGGDHTILQIDENIESNLKIDEELIDKIECPKTPNVSLSEPEPLKDEEEELVKEKKKLKKKEKKKMRIEDNDCKEFEMDESLDDLKPLSMDDHLIIAENLPHGEHVIQEEEHHDPLDEEKIELKEEEQLFQSDERPFDDKDRLFIENDESLDLIDRPHNVYEESDLKEKGGLKISEEELSAVAEKTTDPKNLYSIESAEEQDTKTPLLNMQQTEPLLKTAHEMDCEPAREDGIRGKTKPKKRGKSTRKPKKSQAEKKAAEPILTSEQPCETELKDLSDIQQQTSLSEEEKDVMLNEEANNIVTEAASMISNEVNSVELATRLIENIPDTLPTNPESSSADTSGMVDSKLKENETLAAKAEAKEEVLDAVKWIECGMDNQEQPSFPTPVEAQESTEIVPIEQSTENKQLETDDSHVIEEVPVPVKVEIAEEKLKKRTRKSGRGSKTKQTIIEPQEKTITIIENPSISIGTCLKPDENTNEVPLSCEGISDNKQLLAETAVQVTEDNSLTVDTEAKPNFKSSVRKHIDPYDFNEEDHSYQRKGKQGKFNSSKKQTETKDSEQKLVEQKAVDNVSTDSKVADDPYEFKGSPAEEKSSPSKAKKPKTPTRRPTGRTSRTRSASSKGKDLKAKDDLLGEPLSEPLPVSPKPDTVAKLLQREENRNANSAVPFEAGKNIASLSTGTRVPMVSNVAVPYIINSSLAAPIAQAIPTTQIMPGSSVIASQLPTMQLTTSPHSSIPSKVNTPENLTGHLNSAPMVTHVPTSSTMVCPVLPGNMNVHNSKSGSVTSTVSNIIPHVPIQQEPPTKRTSRRSRKKDENAQKQSQQPQEQIPTKQEPMQHQPQIALTRPPLQLGVPLQVHVPQQHQTMKPAHLSPAQSGTEVAEKVGFGHTPTSDMKFSSEQQRIYQSGHVTQTSISTLAHQANLNPTQIQTNIFTVPSSVSATTYAAASVLRERLLSTSVPQGRDNTKVVTSQMQYVPGYAMPTSSDARPKNESLHRVIQPNADYVSQERKDQHQVVPPGRGPHPNVHVVGGPMFFIPPPTEVASGVPMRPLTPGFPQPMVPPGIFPYSRNILFQGVDHLQLASPGGSMPSPRMPAAPVSSPGLSPKITSPNSQIPHKRGTPPVSVTEKKEDDPNNDPNKASHLHMGGLPLSRMGFPPMIHRHMPPVITEPHISTPIAEQVISGDLYKVPAGYQGHTKDSLSNDPHSQGRRIQPGMEAPGQLPNRIPPPPPASSPMQRKQDHLGSIMMRYPVMWQGGLALKNETAFIQMHYVSGSMEVAGQALSQTMSMEEDSPPLRVAQRMRLEQSQLEGVGSRMKVKSESCILIALACGRDHHDVISQTEALNTGFITYLQQKQAAGIINVPHPGSNQPAFVVHIFPPCDFTQVNLAHVAPDFFRDIADLAHLMIVITTTS